MIKRLEVKYIGDIAVAHKLAWQRAFQGILSDTLLDALTDIEFIWKSKVGYELMTNAIQHLMKKDNYNGVVLWTMSGNVRSRSFYEKVGFRATEQRRLSRRNNESFEEIK